MGMHDGHLLSSGIDLVENSRMAEALMQWGARFKNRVFLPSEQRYCEAAVHPERRYAARFAVKEAVAKAMTTGIGRQLSWLDITVERDNRSGAPTVSLSSRARALARKQGIAHIHVSLSHTRRHAVAMALAVSERHPQQG